MPSFIQSQVLVADTVPLIIYQKVQFRQILRSLITNVIQVTGIRVFPDISITCDGFITSLIVGTSSKDSNFPLVQLRRSSMIYTVLTVNTNDGALISTNVYNFTLSNPVEVKVGDILVINSNEGTFPMYYQQFNGPLNYVIFDNNIQLLSLPANDYPLISLVIGKCNK